MSVGFPSGRSKSVFRAFLIALLVLGLFMLLLSMQVSWSWASAYSAPLRDHATIIGCGLFLLTFGVAYDRWHAVKFIQAVLKHRPGEERGRFIINAGLSLVVLLIVAALVTSLYQEMGGSVGSKENLWRDPQIISVAIGLILSVLFVDRWRSLEGKVDTLSSDYTTRLKDIQQFANEQIELKVGQVVDRAEKVSAKLASISEQNPWLEVVTERDIVVETESIRGILRSSYKLLNDGKLLHLFEYLEFSSRKGTDSDIREEKRSLRGTAEDFLEIATFCEVWLEDHALATEFIRRYIDQAGAAAYMIYPDFILRLLRTGNLPAVRVQTEGLAKIIWWRQMQRRFPLLDIPNPVTERYYWSACNALAISYAAMGRSAMSKRYLDDALESASATLYADEQRGFDAERLCYQGEFAEALDMLNKQEDDNTNFGDVARRITLYERLKQFEKAALLRRRVERAKGTAFGDYWPAPDVDKAASPTTEPPPPAQAASNPAQTLPRNRGRAVDPPIDPDWAPGQGPNGNDIGPPAR